MYLSIRVIISDMYMYRRENLGVSSVGDPPILDVAFYMASLVL